MSLNYINQIIKENNLFLNNDYKKNNNIFLKEFNNSTNQICKSTPILFTEDKFMVFSTANKFNSVIIKRKHIYKRGFYSTLFFKESEKHCYRLPSSFLYKNEVFFINKKEDESDFLVDSQYSNNINNKYYKKLRKLLIKTFYRCEKQYLWRNFVKKYNLNFSLYSVKNMEVTKLYISKTLLEQTIHKYVKMLTRLRLISLVRTRQTFPVFITSINRAGVKMELGSFSSSGFAFYDKVFSSFIKVRDFNKKFGKIIRKTTPYMYPILLPLKIVKFIPYHVPIKKHGKSRFLLSLSKNALKLFEEKYLQYFDIKEDPNIIRRLPKKKIINLKKPKNKLFLKTFKNSKKKQQFFPKKFKNKLNLAQSLYKYYKKSS